MSEARRKRDLPQRRTQLEYRQMIGWLGFVLPELVYVFAAVLETKGLTSWQVLDSVSAYHYTGAVSVFVGILFALGVLLLTLPGYEGVTKDRVVGTIGGIGALGVAIFPTVAPDGVLPASWWSPAVGIVHFVAAAALFGSFAVFALWLFRLSEIPTPSARPKDKQRRDTVYLVCGIVIVVCLLLVPVAKYFEKPIFWPEAVAIKAFAISWLIKGELNDSAMAQRVLHGLGLKQAPGLESETRG